MSNYQGDIAKDFDQHDNRFKTAVSGVRDPAVFASEGGDFQFVFMGPYTDLGNLQIDFGNTFDSFGGLVYHSFNVFYSPIESGGGVNGFYAVFTLTAYNFNTL